jgi:hypothetical protein
MRFVHAFFASVLAVANAIAVAIAIAIAIAVVVVVAVVVSSVAVAHTPPPTPASDPADDHHVSKDANTGQDPTKPLTRIDLRLKYQNFPSGLEATTGTLRADVPFKLGGGWKLSTRFDLPLVYGDVPSLDNPNGDYEFGVADTLAQFLFITPPVTEDKKLAFALGTQVLFPTGSDDQFGTGKWQLAPSAAAIYQLPEIRPGSFAGLLVRDQFSFAGNDGRDDIHDLIVQPILNVTLPQRWFFTIAPEIRIDLEDGDGVFIPANLTVGWKPKRDMVISLSADVPIVDDYEQYDWQTEFRIGFFF